MEDLVLQLRRELRQDSALGEFGAAAIHRELFEREYQEIPSIRTINRILQRRGALDGQRRRRRKAPPGGWYLPEVAVASAELDQFDIVEGLVLRDGPEVEVLNTIALHSGLVGSWPSSGINAQTVREALLEHWKRFGLPMYAQFDNDTRFTGPHHHGDVIGSVMRLCLSLAVVPVFAPVAEYGFQADIESFNGRWQSKVWNRFQHPSLEALQQQSARYVTACHHRGATRRETAPPRRPFPENWQIDWQSQPQGLLIFLRRSSDCGNVELLGHTFTVDPYWVHRLVRCEIDLNSGCIRFYALRRRDPTHQPLLGEVPYQLPRRSFRI
jgi:hypothetical protein